MSRILGIIGGMGPMASAYLVERITALTRAARDADHIELLLYSRPSIPDRTKAILAGAPSPLPLIQSTARALCEAGAGVLAMPCITAHAYYDELAAALPVPLLHMPRETAREVAARGEARAGILATDGTVKAGVLTAALEEYGVTPILPSPRAQAAVMSLIYDDIKAGRAPDMAKFALAAEELRGAGAGVILLGCTELSLLPRENRAPDILDPIDILARAAILACGGEVIGE